MAMDFGKVEYTVSAKGCRRVLRLTLIGQGDEDTLRTEGLAGLRRKRVLRLACEAHLQGSPIGYEDLSSLLLASLATLKRDVNSIEKNGRSVPLKGRRKNGNSNGNGNGNNGGGA